MAWITRSELRGPVGTFDEVTAIDLPAGAKPTAHIGGTPEHRTLQIGIPEGKRGLPGLDAVPADEGIATLLGAEDSETGGAARSLIAEATEPLATKESVGALQVFAHRWNENWTIGLGDSNFDPASGGTAPVGTSLFEQACAQSGQQIAKLRNAGVGGDRLEDMLARLDADVLAHRPDRVLFMGGTNNVTSSLHTVETMAVTAKMIWDRLTGHGVAVAVVSIPPATSTTEVRDKILDWNAWQASECQARGIPYIDIHSAVSDGAGGWAPGMNRDNLHFTTAGAMLAGGIIADSLALLWKPGSPVVLHGEPGDLGNMVGNPELAQNVASGYPDFWNATLTAGTIAAVPDAGVHGNWARFTRTASSGVLTAHYRVASGVVEGDLVEFAVKARPPAGSSVTYSFYVAFEDATNNHLLLVRGAAYWVSDAGGGPMVLYGRAVVPVGAASARFYLHTSDGVGSVDFAQPVMRKVG